MIYAFPDEQEPIRQGDIFSGIPLADLSLRMVPVFEKPESPVQRDWRDIAKSGAGVKAVVSLTPVFAIVISQDCDASLSRDISLCEIRPFNDVEGLAKDTKKPASWASIITQQARKNDKWFYLPPDQRLGFEDRMGVDFTVTMAVPREDLEELRQLRLGRLNDVAGDHFRQRLADFFRRYPYDEWYPLNRDELAAYQKAHPNATPFPWQAGREEKD